MLLMGSGDTQMITCTSGIQYGAPLGPMVFCLAFAAGAESLPR